MSGRRSREKGHRYERQIATQLKQLFERCCTSRSESKNMDDKGIDLCNTDPFYFQLKNTERQPNFREVLKEMNPEDFSHYRVVLHHQNRKPDLAVMQWDDLFELLEMLIKNKVL